MGVFSDIKPRNHAARNGFDLGRFSTFSSKAGFIIPVFQQETLPSSEYSLDIKQLLRTQPLQKAAFTGFSINYDIVWMPYNHLYQSFNQFIAQRENKNSTVQPSHERIPTFNLGKFLRPLFHLAFWDYMMSFVEDFPEGNDRPVAGVKTLLITEHMPNESAALNAIRNLDLLEYGNYLPVLKQAYKSICGEEYYAFTIEGESYNKQVDWTHFYYDTDTSIADLPKWPLKLFLQYKLGIFFDGETPEFDNVDSINGAISEWIDGYYIFGRREGTLYELFTHLATKSPNLWPALAYNKAFYEYYRNTYYDTKFRIGSWFELTYNERDYVTLFNMDDVTSNIECSNNIDTANFMRLLSIFTVKPHLYKRDLFTGVLPSTQFGDVSVASADDVFAKLIGNGSESTVALGAHQAFAYSDGFVKETATSQSVAVRSDKFKFDPSPIISVLEMRKADAMQRFKERMMRAGDKTKDIFKAHGWDEPKSELSYEPIFLGSFDGRLDINVVAATNESDNVELAQLGANGMAVVNGNKVKIKTSDFGVLMVLFHIEKDAVYDSYGINLSHTATEPFDYPYPELQNISLAPVPKESLNLMDSRHSDVIGFLPRSIQHKTAVDKVHGEFFSSLPKNFDFPDGYLDAYDDYYPVSGAFSDWVAPRENIVRFNTLEFLYCNPHCVDTIFKQQSNVRQDSDQFFVNVRFDCYAVEPLPVIGLPI